MVRAPFPEVALRYRPAARPGAPTPETNETFARPDSIVLKRDAGKPWPTS